MSKTISDQLNEVNGELQKLKSSIEEIKEIFDRSNIGEITSVLESMKIFMQQTVSTLGDIKKTLGDLSGQGKILYNMSEKNGSIKEKDQLFQKSPPMSNVSTLINETINLKQINPAITQTTIAEIPIVMAYPAPPTLKPQEQSKIISTRSLTEPKPEIHTNHADAKQLFETIITAANNNTFARELGKMIDTARGMISKSDSLNPILFELSMEAGRLKIMGEKSLNKEGIDKLEKTVNKWKLKC